MKTHPKTPKRGLHNPLSLTDAAQRTQEPPLPDLQLPIPELFTHRESGTKAISPFMTFNRNPTIHIFLQQLLHSQSWSHPRAPAQHRKEGIKGQKSSCVIPEVPYNSSAFPHGQQEPCDSPIHLFFNKQLLVPQHQIMSAHKGLPSPAHPKFPAHNYSHASKNSSSITHQKSYLYPHPLLHITPSLP